MSVRYGVKKNKKCEECGAEFKPIFKRETLCSDCMLKNVMDRVERNRAKRISEASDGTESK